MTLRKLLLCLTVLVVVSSSEIVQPRKIPIGTEIDVSKFFPNGTDVLTALFRNLTRNNTRSQVAILNDYTEDLLTNLGYFIMSSQLDPVPMPDIVNDFEWYIWPITYHGEMSLTAGWLQGLSTMERRDNVLLWYEYPNIKIEMKLGYNVLVYDYQYVAQFMGLGPSGGLDGKVEGCKWTLELDLNLLTLKANLAKYKLDSLGKVSLKFHGGLLTWMVNIFVSVVLPWVKPVIKLVVEGVIYGGLIQVINYYNNVITGFLTPW